MWWSPKPSVSSWRTRRHSGRHVLNQRMTRLLRVGAGAGAGVGAGAGAGARVRVKARVRARVKARARVGVKAGCRARARTVAVAVAGTVAGAGACLSELPLSTRGKEREQSLESCTNST